MTTLDERRTIFVYEAARMAAIAANAPIIPDFWVHREQEFKDQMIQNVKQQCGPNKFKDAAEAHQSWVDAYKKMSWRYGETYDRMKKIHPDMVPYDQLGQLEKDKDDVYIMLCAIAERYIY